MPDNNASFHTVISRVESLETRLSENTQRIETRLDDLIELMQKVTQLQEREARNASDIRDLRDAIKIIIDNEERMNQRWHERLTAQAKEIEYSKNELKASFEVEHKEIEHDIKCMRAEHAHTKELFNTWLNRGLGAWVVLSVIIGLLQTWGGMMFNASLEEVKQIKTKIIQIETLHQKELNSLPPQQ